jgi:hypothetical protein
MKSWKVLALLGVLGGTAGLTRAAGTPPHDRQFWENLRAQHFKLPAGAPAAALTRETLAFIPLTDARLRDEIGYEAFAAWVYRDQLLTSAQLESLQPALMSSAGAGLGESEGDGVFGRSFALLDLSVLAAADLKRPFLSSAAHAELLDLALESLTRERDLRGYVPGKGWAHATAHAADLLKFLARSPQLRPADAPRIVNGIAGRLRSAQQVFVWGEDARLAEALLALAVRTDVPLGAFTAWIERLQQDYTALWSGEFDSARYRAVQAQLNALAQLAARLPSEAGTPGALQLRTRLQQLLLDSG